MADILKALDQDVPPGTGLGEEFDWDDEVFGDDSYVGLLMSRCSHIDDDDADVGWLQYNYDEESTEGEGEDETAADGSNTKSKSHGDDDWINDEGWYDDEWY